MLTWLREQCRRLRAGPATPAAHTSELGARAEEFAAHHLRQQGYHIDQRNLRLRQGEVDMIALHEGWLVVVEVRSYKQGSPLPPHATLSREKQARLRRLAEEVRKRQGRTALPVRIDLVEVGTDASDQPVTAEVFRGAC